MDTPCLRQRLIKKSLYNSMTHSKSDNTAEEQASHWQAQLSSDLITEQTRDDFAAWLAESPSHQAAWRKVNTFWRALDNVTAAELNLQVRPVFTPVNFMPVKTATRNFYRPAAGIAAAILIAVAILARPFDY
jgi:transmembrane sensor